MSDASATALHHSWVHYTMHVLGKDATGNFTQPLAEVSGAPLDPSTPSQLGFSATVAGQDSVCIYVTTSSGPRKFDRAPDLAGSCFTFAPGVIAEYGIQ